MVRKYDKQATTELHAMAWVKPAELVGEQEGYAPAPTSQNIQATIDKGANVNDKGNGGKTF